MEQTDCVIPDKFIIRQPKHIATITVCGAFRLLVDDTMNFVKPTPEQIKNLHDVFCIDVEILEDEQS